MLCLLVGNVLLIGVASSTPMYAMASITRMMHQSMSLRQATEGIYPVFSQLRYAFNNAEDPVGMYEETRDIILYEMLDTLGIPVSQTVRTYSMTSWSIQPMSARATTPRTINLLGIQDLTQNTRLLHGRMPANHYSNVIEALAMDVAMFRNDLLLDELIRTSEPDIFIRVVGLIELPPESLPFWAVVDPDFTENLIICETVVQDMLTANYRDEFRIAATWANIHDFFGMTGGNITRYQRGINDLTPRFMGMSMFSFEQNYYEVLREHIARTAEFSITLIMLQVPLYALLGFFIYVISRKILQQEQNDISVLKSRGASRRQIFNIYVGQGLVMGGMAFPFGVALGMAICHLLGASRGFLQIMERSPVVVELSAQALLFGGAAALFSFFAMILPVIGFSKVGIVEHKRGKSGKPKKSLWQRYFLDIICLGASLYSIYNFNIQQTLATGTSDFVDPTMFIASSLFIIGFGLFCLRVFPYIVKLIFYVGRKYMPIGLYTAMTKVARSMGEEQFIMIFLVFTMAIGIFSAQAARTINLNAEHEIRYLGGTNVVIQEFWSDNTLQIVSEIATEMVFVEPNFERFTHFDAVDSITRVMIEPQVANIRPPGTPFFVPRPVAQVHAEIRRAGEGAIRESTTLMAIEPQHFGETIWFRDDFLPIHINYFLNVLSQVPNGVLVSYNFREQGASVGDTLRLYHDHIIATDTVTTVIENDVGIMTIVGFIDRWPTFIPSERHETQEGTIFEIEHSLVVGNFNYLQNHWGIWPYEIWLRTNTDSIQFLHDFIEAETLHPEIILHDTANEIAQGLLDPLVQGTNGVLTVNFIITLIVCFAGFLLYWILSIRERVLQFGIFRAMGMSLQSIIGLLINEQILITITALIIGAVVGEVSARLYVPMLQMAYTQQIIPLLVIMEARDYAGLFMVMGAMILICLVVLITFISKIRIDQALKLGED